MPSISVDTGPLVALFNRGDRQYESAHRFFEQTNGDLITNVAVLTETAHLLSFSSSAVIDALQWINAAFEIDPDTGSDLPRIREIIAKYTDLPADFADASLITMCERRSIERIATFDKDFQVYRMANGRALHNVLATA